MRKYEDFFLKLKFEFQDIEKAPTPNIDHNLPDHE